MWDLGKFITVTVLEDGVGSVKMERRALDSFGVEIEAERKTI